ncbi:MAG: hypothetical protein LBS29_06355 [Endomicrobium sp.]|jgi:hypothetical protein|nr:hypothetical protein [Endomicrobium sp.]
MAEDKKQEQSPQGNNTDELDPNKIRAEEKIERNHDIEGLLIGGAVGLIVGMIISFNAIFAMQIGMFLGLVVGVKIKKK